MIRFRAFSSVILSASVLFVSVSAMAQTPYKVTVRDVSTEYGNNPPSIFPTPVPTKPTGGPTDPAPGDIPPLPDPLPDLPTTSDYPGSYPSSTGTVDNIIILGTKVWDFIVNNKPTADYKTLKANVVPEGVSSFTQLLWKRTNIINKVYRVEFKTITGKSAGGFDYRLSFIYGGTYQGKGKYIGQIAVAPLNVKLHTDRSLNFRAEVLDPLNFGTEDDPVAATQLLITWSSPTTVRYTMNSAEYMLFGDGEIQELPNALR